MVSPESEDSYAEEPPYQKFLSRVKSHAPQTSVMGAGVGGVVGAIGHPLRNVGRFAVRHSNRALVTAVDPREAYPATESVSYTHLTLPTKRIV